MNNCLGFIGGSGLYELNFLNDIKYHDLSSSFGAPSDKILEGSINGNKIYFLPRHGKGHKLSPSSINYRANIDCLKQCGVTDLISLSAVGSLKEDLPPGTFVLVDQFIDRTINRKKSFFEDDIVAHVPMAHPISKELMDSSEIIFNKLKLNYSKGGTYLAMEGPQFSTYAESTLYKQWGCDVIGMTNMPEAKLAKEAEIRYCSISMVTDYDCWHPDHDNVDINILLKNLNDNVENSKLFIDEFSKFYYEGIDFSNNDTSTILDSSIVTSIDNWDKETEQNLSNILKRYKYKNQ
jgi:5'-methylthioadenosine phosphorylase